MKKEIPEIDSLLDGINDPDAVLNPTSGTPLQPESIPERDSDTSAQPSPEVEDIDVASTERYWNHFMKHLSESDIRSEKDDHLVCKLDRDLADSLDDCDIDNRSRSDLVNAIIRAFFGTFMPKLIQFRREKKSLFQHYIHS